MQNKTISSVFSLHKVNNSDDKFVYNRLADWYMDICCIWSSKNKM